MWQLDERRTLETVDSVYSCFTKAVILKYMFPELLANLLVCWKTFECLAGLLPCVAASVLSSQSLKSTLKISHILTNLIFFFNRWVESIESKVFSIWQAL